MIKDCLLEDKYNPLSFGEFIIDSHGKEILDNMAHAKYVPNIIFTGPSGSGKKTLAYYYLEKVFGKEIHNTKINKYTVTGNNSKDQIDIKQSMHHIVIEPHYNNHDKYILQDIIKTYATTNSFALFNDKQAFKVILITGVDELSFSAQTSIRRTMEIYAKVCRFVMICKSASKVIEPLRSRCYMFRVPCPSITNIYKLILTLDAYEHLNLTDKEIAEIIKKADRNLNKIYWLIELKKHKCYNKTSVEELIDSIASDVWNTKSNFPTILIRIRNSIYNLLITNIDSSDILKMFTEAIFQLMCKHNNDKHVAKLFELATIYEHRGFSGRREINHLEGFITALLYELNVI